MFLLIGGPGSMFFSMPSRPDRSITASARYGLHDGSGIRSSMRVPVPRVAGTRTSGLRFFSDQEIAVGASYPGTRRLYEFTSGFVMAQKPFAWRRMPPMYWRHVSLS